MAIYAAHQFFVQDGEGNVVPGAHVEVRQEIPGQPLAALKADRDGSTGKTNPFDADSDGLVYFHVAGGSYQIRVYTDDDETIYRYVGIGLNSESDSVASKTQREVTAAGAVTMTADDVDIIVINKTVGAATTFNLCSAADRTKPIMVVDGKGDAATNNITIVPESGESVYATVDYTPVIDGNGGSLTLTPKEDGSGWF